MFKLFSPNLTHEQKRARMLLAAPVALLGLLALALPMMLFGAVISILGVGFCLFMAMAVKLTRLFSVLSESLFDPIFDLIITRCLPTPFIPPRFKLA